MYLEDGAVGRRKAILEKGQQVKGSVSGRWSSRKEEGYLGRRDSRQKAMYLEDGTVGRRKDILEDDLAE